MPSVLVKMPPVPILATTVSTISTKGTTLVASATRDIEGITLAAKDTISAVRGIATKDTSYIATSTTEGSTTAGTTKAPLVWFVAVTTNKQVSSDRSMVLRQVQLDDKLS